MGQNTPPAHVTPLGSWELRGSILTPTRCTLQARATHLQSQQDTDPMVEILVYSTITNTSPAQTFKIHRSLLERASEPLKALVAQKSPVQEFEDTFATIRKFLYLEPIDLTTASLDLPLAAARWNLPVLHQAIFAYVERYGAVNTGVIYHWMPVLKAIPAPETFKTVLALRFVTLLDQGFDTDWFTSHGCWGDWRRMPDGDGKYPVDCCVCGVAKQEMDVDRASRQHDGKLESIEENEVVSAAVQLRTRIDENICRCGGEKRPCGDTSTVWEVFQKQSMMPEVAKYMMTYGQLDYGALLLDVVLRQIEPFMTDNEILGVLGAFSWHDGYTEMLHGDVARKWTVRGCQLLIKARDNAQLGWDETRVGLHVRAVKKAIPEPGVRTVTWESQARDLIVDGVKIPLVITIECASRKNKRLPPLLASIKTSLESKGIPKQVARINAALVESQCGCTLRQSDAGFAGGPIPVEGEILVTSLAKIGGVSVKLMEGHVLKKWIEAHEPDCGLIFVVKLWIRKDLPAVKDKLEERGRWKQDWQLECECGTCHRSMAPDSSAIVID